ncbi:ABC transporter ATP-binding protein [Mesorhizobium sp. C280B]|uniref:ABC transporter ATP-binding protein n=1 Tax=unclassified Mesorhizobium TaxID=325217 RepID=UPI0003CEFF40|nr:ABC transporter ATP-binding protein [Mesorhizobium sp. LSJC280B00]ESW86206.1 nitrate ABC transporter ATPase [Mesorhizobium sp. LSJC280B00]
MKLEKVAQQPGSVSGPTLLALRGVGKVFSNGVTALSNVELTIREGDFLSLLGPSGCGKSTALRLIAGLSTPTSGVLDWRGSGALERSNIGDRSNIGFVFQEPTLLPWADVFDNVWLPLRLKGVSRAKAAPAVMEMLARVHLTGFEKAVPRELSGGMKMRVSIARAMVTKPRILLMDEPFAALDEITRFKLNNDLLELWQDERFTVVFVTHSVFESVFLSNRIVVMAARPGRVFAELAVDASYPRDEAFRTSPDYAALCRQASDVLIGAINSTAGPHHDGH